eukprot:5474076-Karenia_brevis.AAC.1
MMKGKAVTKIRMKRLKKDRVIYIDTRGKVPRSFKIRKDDTFKHKGTSGCPGCSAVEKNMAFQQHTQEYKSRFEEILKEDAK